MRRYSLKVLLATALLALVTSTSAQTRLKWAHVYETSEPFHKWALWAADEIKKRSNGRYQIDVYPASQLGKDNDIVQGMTIGAIDMSLSGSSFFAKSFPRVGILYYPYTFRDSDHLLAYSKSDIFREFVDGIAQKSGHQILSLSYYGTRNTTSNRPITKCADMKGQKIRVPDVAIYQAMPRACGANTAPIAFAEVYLALQNGTVDGEENPLTTIEAKKFYEVQKNIVLTGHVVDHVNTVVAGHLWKKLSEADRKIFTEVAQEASSQATADIRSRENELVTAFRKRGLNVVEVDKDEFRDAVVKNISFEQYGFVKKDFDRIQAIR